MSEVESIGYCLECAHKHSRDLEHHLEDGVTYSAGDEAKRKKFQDLVDRIRKIRKEIDQMRLAEMQDGTAVDEESCPTCAKTEGVGPLNPTGDFEKEQIKPAEYFDPQSFRVLCPECPDQRCAKCPPELEPVATRVIIGCKKGEFEEGRCQIATEKHVVFHNPAHNPGEEIELLEFEPDILEQARRSLNRLTLIDKETGYVTVIEPTKKGTKFIYGMFVLPAEPEYGKPEELGREERWDMAKYRILPGARWDLREQEDAHREAMRKFEDERRHALWGCESEARTARDKCMDEWYSEHPAPKNPLLE